MILCLLLMVDTLKLAPYDGWQTPMPRVMQMLDMAQVGPGDTLLDLGCGDGRIVIEAVRRGAVGVGIDIDPERIAESKRNAEAAGVSAVFVCQNALDADLSQATVITMYLLWEINQALKPRLQQCRAGTRIVSYDFDMDDWPPDSSMTTEIPYIHLWRVR